MENRGNFIPIVCLKAHVFWFVHLKAQQCAYCNFSYGSKKGPQNFFETKNSPPLLKVEGSAPQTTPALPPDRSLSLPFGLECALAFVHPSPEQFHQWTCAKFSQTPGSRASQASHVRWGLRLQSFPTLNATHPSDHSYIYPLN